MVVIGLSAKLGCGKTTLAKLLMDEAPVEVAVRLAFGDQVKRECSEYFGFPLEWCYSQEGKTRVVGAKMKGFAWDHKPDDLVELGDLTVREALQWYGTDFRRAQDPGYWIKAMQKQLMRYRERHAGETLLVVVDDVRFPDEAQVCLDHGYCFRIEPHQYWEPGPHADHASETALDGYDKFTDVFKPGFGLDELRLVAVKIIWRVLGEGKEKMEGGK